MPDVTKQSLNELVDLLDSPNLTLQVFAVNELVDRFGPQAAAPLRRLVSGAGSPAQRAFGLWVLERLGQLDSELVTRLAADPAAMVRVHVVKALAERAAWTGSEAAYADLLRNRLADEDAFVRRAAAEALGKHPSLENVEALITLWRQTDPSDTHLIHTVRMALRDHVLKSGLLAQLQQNLNFQSDAARRVAEVCLGAATDESASFVFAWLAASEKEMPALAEYTHHAARRLPEERLPDLIALFTSRKPWQRPEIIRSFGRAAQERGRQPAEPVVEAAREVARRLLDNPQEARVREGIELAREFRLADLHADLAEKVAPAAPHAALRPLALEACAAVDAAAATPLIAAVLTNAEEPFALRQKAAQVLAGLPSDLARETLLSALRTAPERLAVEIAAGLAGTRPNAELLLSAISEGKASPQLLLEPVVSIRLQLSQPSELAERRAKLSGGLPPRDQKLRQIIDQRRAGFQKAALDPEAGQQLFTKTCAACHKLRQQGNKIGPELDGIANRGLDRLLEDLLDPSRNVDQAFRSTVLSTTDGRIINGLALREEGQVLVLADAQGKEVRVPMAEIAERSVSPLSPMPANLIDVLSEADFYQLLGFLLQQRAK